MKITTIRNVTRQALKPDHFIVMIDKLRERLIDLRWHCVNPENLKWVETHCSDFEDLAMRLDGALWAEAVAVSKTIKDNAQQTLQKIDQVLGGGGVYPFLYFITRYMQPDCIVETGVAAGFSSYAFLLGLQTNGRGTLYSSDFPYFRLPNPEQYIGIVVPDSLKPGWKLYTNGDKANLKKIISEINTIDIFHYDSDKTYSGRVAAMSMIEGRLSERGVILMDDIQDNPYFYNYVKKRKPAAWRIFKFQGKYIGIIGELTNGLA